MELSTVQQSAQPRNTVTPVRSTEMREQGQGNLPKPPTRAEEPPRNQQVEVLRRQDDVLQRRFDGRLVRVGERQEIEDLEQARADMMRQKIAAAYRTAERPPIETRFEPESDILAPVVTSEALEFEPGEDRPSESFTQATPSMLSDAFRPVPVAQERIDFVV